METKPPFQLVYLPNACEAYISNIYIPATVKLTRKDPTVTLPRCFHGFDLTYINISDYHFMQALNKTNSFSIKETG